MTIKDLIANLNEFDPNMVVCILDRNNTNKLFEKRLNSIEQIGIFQSETKTKDNEILESHSCVYIK